MFGSIENPSSYYYRVAVLSQNTIRKRVAGHHFNVRTSCLGGLEFSIPEAINRYLNYAVRQYEKGWYFNFFSVLCHYVWYHDMLLYMKQLTNEGLNEQIEKLLESFPGIYEIQDLNLYRKKAGIYILVLDKYHVCYIGQSNNITARIMRHWSRSDYYTGTGIDVFKAFDTTRIYVLPASEYKINQLEWEMVDAIDKQYVLNKFTGGTIDFHIENDLPLMIDEDGSIDNFFATPLKANETNFPMYLTHTYEIPNPAKMLKNLESKGFIEVGSSKDVLSTFKVSELKEIASSIGITVKGKKADIISQLSSVDEESISRYVTERNWKLTERGHAAISANPYIQYFLEKHNYNVADVGVDIWTVNKEFVKNPNRPYRDIIYRQLNDQMNKAAVALQKDPAAGSSNSYRYCECYRLMGLFI